MYKSTSFSNYLPEKIEINSATIQIILKYCITPDMYYNLIIDFYNKQKNISHLLFKCGLCFFYFKIFS